MTQEFNDPEIFADFIVEAKEHLETIEPNLLELEKAPDNLGLLNEIFRPMHSLKGASGFLGLKAVNSLAHRAESILDELRKGEMAVTSEIMDIILSATDALRQMVDNLENLGHEGDVDIAPIIDSIETLLHGGPKEAPAPKPSRKSAAKPKSGSAAARTPESDPRPFVELKDLESYALTTFGEGHLADFLEEAKEMIQDLNVGLLELEKDPTVSGEIVNDLFRYFHNLKGNSGIIGFIEINTLTHEAETLLNRVRKGEMQASRGLIDLLLSIVDIMEILVERVDSVAGTVTPIDVSEWLAKLQKAVQEGVVEATDRRRISVASARKGDAFEGGMFDTMAESAEEEAPAELDLEDLNVFKATVEQQMERIHEALAQLKQDDSQIEMVDSLHRSLKSLQNSSNYMNLEEIKVYTERTASLVDQARKTDLPFSAMQDLLEQESAIIGDMLKSAIEKLESDESLKTGTAQQAEPGEKTTTATEQPKKASPRQPVSEKPKAAAKPQAAEAQTTTQKPKVSATIRVDHERLDHLMNLIGELIINRNRYAMLARGLEELAVPEANDIALNLTETTYSMARISDDLQDTIMKVRMVPISTVFTRFPRLVRDLSRKSGKDMELITEGEETELDKSVVEVLGDPLVHLIRNSVDHGIESEEQRKAAGKDPKGRIWLRAYHRGNSVAIEVEDDGKGIDPEKMREVGVRKGVVTAEEARNLDDREALELIFAPGFSSAEKVTDISGRGVGMDVVRTNIKNLKGSINITSEVGKGSRFTLSLPLTLAIIDALMVKVSDETFAIPLDAVSETTKIEARKLTDVHNRRAVTMRDQVLGIINMSELLELSQPEKEPDILSVVVIHDNERRLGLVVDKLLERQEIVIKPLGMYLGDQKGISGATIMGDGSVVLILDPHEIYLMATSKAI